MLTEAPIGKADTSSRLRFEVHLLEDARIPSLTVEKAPADVPDSSFEVAVQEMSGVSTKVAIPEPRDVATLKHCHT